MNDELKKLYIEVRVNTATSDGWEWGTTDEYTLFDFPVPVEGHGRGALKKATDKVGELLRQEFKNVNEPEGSGEIYDGTFEENEDDRP
tara:strand:- start:560 stop:823 length:264 start_codon:yes stop_codon:yes gene_type:complete